MRGTWAGVFESPCNSEKSALICLVDGEALLCVDPAGVLMVVEKERRSLRYQLGLGQGRAQSRKVEREGREGAMM